MLDVYHSLTKDKSTLPGLCSVIISSGTADPVVSMHGTEKAVRALGLPHCHGCERRPWFYNATATDLDTLRRKAGAWGPFLHAGDEGVQVGGFTEGFTTTSGVELQYVSVRGSGHMVS